MEGIKDLIEWKEIYDAYRDKKTINTNKFTALLRKYKAKEVSDFYNDDGTIKDTMIEKAAYTGKNRPTIEKQTKLTNKEKKIIEKYKNEKLPLEEATEDLLNKYPDFKQYIKEKITYGDGTIGERYLKKEKIENNFKKLTQESATKAEELKEDTKQIKQKQNETHNAGSEAVKRQNKINDELRQQLEAQGLTIDQMQEIIDETNKRYEADKAERQAEKEDKKRSKAFKELVKEMSQQDDITTTDKGELIKRLLKNHSDIIHDEETAKAAADAIFRNALNKKVVSKKQRQYLYNFYKAYPQFVEQLPEEQQEAINAEIMDKYNEQQKNKVLHYMLPKERPRWEKATTQHNLNPMLGRRSYG